ncbi:MAG: hypothetical protein K8H89_03665 [Flavobacteriales bacterium]|nr:hypothetical protein [Flavobacteriales bacterium]
MNSVQPGADGTLIASGIMRFPGEFSDQRLVRLLPNGSRDPSFNNSGLGGGKIIPWEDKLYVDAGLIRRILLPSGNLDQSFRVGYSTIPYFLIQQGGDYHVFPDGRVLLTGQYLLSDTVRGYEGQYNLVWITNTGYLDTTRTHRQANGPLWEFSEMPDGRFICTCSCSQYDGQPVDKLFRIEADGALDTSFHTDVNYGNIYTYSPLADGRVLVGGNFKRAAAPDEVLQLVRLLPDGSLDPTFDNHHQFGIGELSGIPKPSGIIPWGTDKYFIAGHYQEVDGEPRGGLSVVDSTGQLLPYFENCTPGPFTYYGQTAASFVGIAPTADSTAFYIWGNYVGYNDGTVNDTLQRFVSRVYLSDIHTGVPETPPEAHGSHFSIQPNPAHGLVTFNFETMDMGSKGGTIKVREVTGKVVAILPMHGPIGQQVWDTRSVSPGTYLVEFRDGKQVLHTEKLIVQQ